MEIKAPPDQKIFNLSGLEVVSSSLEPGGHETMLYFVPPAKASDRKCHNCGDQALFILYDKDHDGDKTIDAYCKECSPESFFELLNKRKSG